MGGEPAAPRPPWSVYAANPADEASLLSLANADPAALSGPELIAAITAAEKALSLLVGIQMRMMAAFAEPFKAGDPTRLATRLAKKHCITGDDDPDQVAQFVPAAAASLAAAEIAAALRIPHLTAGNRVREAETMTTTLAPTLRALEQGVLDRGKARIIDDHCRPLTPEHTAAVQDLVLPDAGTLNTSELRELTAHAVITVDPDGAAERHRNAAARRDLALRPQPEAMATLSAYLPADGAVKIFQVTDLLATATAGCPGDNRGIGARRVDALIDIADHLLTHGYLDIGRYLDNPLPDHHGAAPSRKPERHPRPAGTGGRDTAASNANPAADQEDTTTASPNHSADTDTADDPTHRTADPGAACETDLAGQPESDTATVPARDPDPAGRSDNDTATVAARDPDLAGQSDNDTATVAARDPDLAGQSDNDTATVAARDPDLAGQSDNDTATVAARDPDTTGQADNNSAPVPTGDSDTAGAAGNTAPAPGHEHRSTARGRSGTGPASGRGTTAPPTSTSSLTSQDHARRRRALTRQGRRPHLSVVIDQNTLAGLNDLPGHLHGFGAIPADLARSIAKSAASITALLADPGSGVITAAGALTYRPTQELRDQIAAQLNVCQFPSCRQPVWRCDLDHRDRFDHDHPGQGGRTDAENTGPLCRRHHLFKHHSEWRLRPDPDGYTMHFTSPTGHDYPSTPRPPLPAHARFTVTTGGTALAERLDAMIAFNEATATTNADDQIAGNQTDSPRHAATPTSSVEDLLTALLIRNAINNPGYEYDPPAADTGQHPDDAPPF